MKAVLTYHSIDDSGSVISLTASELEKQLDEILASGAKVVPLDAVHGWSGESNAIAITFDDGFANFSQAALPLLRARQIPASVFIVPQYVGSSNGWESADARARVPALPLMTWDTLCSLGDSVEIGAHGLSHKSLKGLTASSLDAELNGCMAMIQSELGKAPTTFAFPYGDFDAAALASAARHFRFACTTDFSLLTRSTATHAIPRLDSFYFRGNSRLKRFGSREFGAWVQVRRVARRARRMSSR